MTDAMDERTLERMARAIFAEMGLPGAEVSDHPITGRFMRGRSRILTDDEVYHFHTSYDLLDPCRYDYDDRVHFQLTEDGRYVRVDSFGNRIEGRAGEVRRLDMSRVGEAAE